MVKYIRVSVSCSLCSLNVILAAELSTVSRRSLVNRLHSLKRRRNMKIENVNYLQSNMCQRSLHDLCTALFDQKIKSTIVILIVYTCYKNDGMSHSIVHLILLSDVKSEVKYDYKKGSTNREIVSKIQQVSLHHIAQN
jgi:uncharacterized protein YjhX (UPF0386 family)